MWHGGPFRHAERNDPPSKEHRMMRRKSIATSLAAAAVVALVALALAGCGSSSKASAAKPTTTNGQPATVGITSSNLGNILVDSNGRTLYMFGKDTGTTSTCTG